MRKKITTHQPPHCIVPLLLASRPSHPVYHATVASKAYAPLLRQGTGELLWESDKITNQTIGAAKRTAELGPANRQWEWLL